MAPLSDDWIIRLMQEVSELKGALSLVSHRLDELGNRINTSLSSFSEQCELRHAAVNSRFDNDKQAIDSIKAASCDRSKQRFEKHKLWLTLFFTFLGSGTGLYLLGKILGIK